jgi:hypothetical protein
MAFIPNKNSSALEEDMAPGECQDLNLWIKLSQIKLSRLKSEFYDQQTAVTDLSNSMINIRDLTVKNFMSVGNATQAINFDRNVTLPWYWVKILILVAMDQSQWHRQDHHHQCFELCPVWTSTIKHPQRQSCKQNQWQEHVGQFGLLSQRSRLSN